MDIPLNQSSTTGLDYQELIRNSPNEVFNWEDSHNCLVPFAHFLIQENQIEALKLLVTQIPEALHQLTTYDESVLYFALKCENYEIARYLIQLERSQTLSVFYGFTKGGQSALTIACDTFCCPNDIIYKLLENGPVFKEDELKLALYNALKARNLDAISLLLDHDSLMLNEILDPGSGKYFMHLLFEGRLYQEEIFEYVWERYREKVNWSVLDNQQATIFHIAMRSTLSPTRLLDLLGYFSQHFPTDYQDIKGNTLLHLAVAWDDVSVVKYCCEELNINSRIKNHDGENALKAAVYRASLGQWELFQDKISYLINRMFKPPHGNFYFEAIADLFSLTSLYRFYETNTRLYPLLIEACYLEETNPYKTVIKDFVDSFHDESFRIKAHFICIFLHDKAVVYPEHQSKRREIIYELGQCLKMVVYNPIMPFNPIVNVIRALQKVPGFSMASHEFCDYSGILYYDLFFVMVDENSDEYEPSYYSSPELHEVRSPVRYKLIEFYHKFDAFNLINFDDIVDINLCKILFQRGMGAEMKAMIVNSEVFRTQLHLANVVTIRTKGCLNHIYDTEDFRLIEKFLGQYDYNRVCCGKKVMSLKLMCREVCRRFVLGKDVKGMDRERVIWSLGLPRVLENFLQYKDC